MKAEKAPSTRKQMHTPMLRLHSASRSEKGWNLLDKYTNLSANWYLPTFTPVQKLLPFFLLKQSHMPVSSHEIETDPFIEED